MIDTQALDDIAKRLALTLPPGLKAVQRELQDNFRAVLGANLDKLDLVSRDRFEAQAALLASATERLKALEGRIQALESAQRQTGSG